MNIKSKMFLGALSSAVLLSSACVPEQTGAEGNLVLTYDKGAAAGATGTSPLAKGAKLNYSVTKADGDKQKLPIDAAQSSDDKVLAVAALSGGAMTLEGLEVGRANIEVDARDGGDSLNDTFELDVVEVDSLKFAHACEPNGEAAYFVDSDIRLHYTMRAGSKVAVGTGYYPVDFLESTGLAIGETGVNGLLPLRTGADAGTVEINSTVSDDSFSLNLVEPKDVRALKVYESEIFSEGLIPVAQGDTATLHVLPLIADAVPVCQSNVAMTVEVSTPETCEVAFTQGPAKTEELFRLYEPQILEVKGLAEGACEFTVRMPDAADGAGARVMPSVKITGSGEADDSATDA